MLTVGHKMPGLSNLSERNESVYIVSFLQLVFHFFHELCIFVFIKHKVFLNTFFTRDDFIA